MPFGIIWGPLTVWTLTAGLRQEFWDAYGGVNQSTTNSKLVTNNYAKAGKGPLIVFIHGFPDFWYTWHAQMEGLMDSYTVCAMDTRGYNLSDKPEKQEDYAMPLLVEVSAVPVDPSTRMR